MDGPPQRNPCSRKGEEALPLADHDMVGYRYSEQSDRALQPPRSLAVFRRRRRIAARMAGKHLVPATLRRAAPPLTLYQGTWFTLNMTMEPTSEQITIGKVAKGAGVNIQTVRYYDRRGLLAPARRLESGYRLYPQDAVRKILFIKNAQALGFTLKEIGSLLRLRAGKTGRCDDVRRKAEIHARDVRAKIESLRSIDKALRRLIKSCARRTATESCPILRSLEDDK